MNTFNSMLNKILKVVEFRVLLAVMFLYIRYNQSVYKPLKDILNNCVKLNQRTLESDP